MSRLLAPLALLAAAVAAIVVLGGGDTDDDGRHVSLVVPEAISIVPGQTVFSGRQEIGKVDELEPIDGGRRARVRLKITYDDAWPLRRGTKVELRWGGTASTNNHYLRVTPGPADAPPIPADATLASEDVSTPVEFDAVLRTFDGRTRRGLRRLLDNGGATFGAARPELSRALDEAPPVVEQSTPVLADATADLAALDQLLRTGDRVVDSIQRADPAIGELIQGAGTTFDAIGDEAQDLETSLARTPATFAQARVTLAKTDRTLVRARRLIDRVAPGVTELRRIARPLNGVLGTLEDVGPDARATLATTRRSTGRIDRFLARTTKVSPQLESIGRQTTKALECIRPWTPEITMLTSTWSDFLSQVDDAGRAARVNVSSLLPGPTMDQPTNWTPAVADRLIPNGMSKGYGFPRAPGTLAGQPWWQPQCGAGPDAHDPAKDTEARNYDPADELLPRPPARKDGER